ncbi:DNA alkylation repair protein|uniref:DNA-7-methylguanine glycosylase n=2 Tax=Dendrosporobacter quercicolus TaxID=146817 RepID=A0A1G9NQP0_9FIRM|nr:DNA alkylation repair protein [Dendrosporobacter quercicolus DSM 1736]SDL88671.1 DNA-7-methylguanine glycosylase [Dendrosporobacter quercicolus]
MERIHLIDDFLNNKDEQQSLRMSAYMRNQFLFLGIPTPLRKKLCKEYFKTAKKVKIVDWEFIKICWDNPYRELQYVAIDYLVAMQNFLTPQDVPKIKELALKKPWWDTIDGLDKLIGNIAFLNPEVNDVLIDWSTDESMWLRRIAIDHQLLRKDKTNTELLEKIIINNFGSHEFFINKAIGWSLRDYSKTNPKWVSCFIEKYYTQLAPLSIKEASKYI